MLVLVLVLFVLLMLVFGGNQACLFLSLSNNRLQLPKFLCLNDDMGEGNQETSNALHEFFEWYFPNRSSFELPPGVWNEFLHVDELLEAQVKDRTLGVSRECLVSESIHVTSSPHRVHSDIGSYSGFVYSWEHYWSCGWRATSFAAWSCVRNGTVPLLPFSAAACGLAGCARENSQKERVLVDGR